MEASNEATLLGLIVAGLDKVVSLEELQVSLVVVTMVVVTMVVVTMVVTTMTSLTILMTRWVTLRRAGM